MRRIRLAGAQLNPVVGDLTGNTEKILAAYRQAAAARSHLAVFPELAVTGYPPEDLVFRPSFLRASQAAANRIAAATGETAALVGFVEPTRAGPANAALLAHRGRPVAVYRKILLPNYGVFDEERYFTPGTEALVVEIPVGTREPTDASTRPYDLTTGGREGTDGSGGPGPDGATVRVAVSICEDLWFPWGPLGAAAATGAEIAVSLNASPYRTGREERLTPMLATRAADHGVHVFYVNQVGGQDELVFDGASRHVDPRGQVLARAGVFGEELLLVDVDVPTGGAAHLAGRPRRSPTVPGLAADHRRPENLPVRVVTLDRPAAATTAQTAAGRTAPTAADGTAANPRDNRSRLPRRLAARPATEEEVYRALVTATRDYVGKNGFREVLVGLSGGIDSSVVAVIAADALGPERVLGVAMPSAYSSEGSVRDARALAELTGVRLEELPIVKPFDATLDVLAGMFAGTEAGLAEENLQSRIRGNLLMALSNKRGSLVLTTGNKSETAVGYSTLYGDTAGGFAVIRDVPKTLVYRVARWRNSWDGRWTGDLETRTAAQRGPEWTPDVMAAAIGPRPGPVIPEAVLEKPPSAELRPGQLDVDSLPPYDVLDPVLEAYVEQDAEVGELVELGFDRAMVERVVGLVDRAEYKRRQNPPGPKITARSFGRDRRLPITNHFRNSRG